MVRKWGVPKGVGWRVRKVDQGGGEARRRGRNPRQTRQGGVASEPPSSVLPQQPTRVHVSSLSLPVTTRPITMSWPSFYGYKYTPIGLRQRERKDDSGTRSICTTVHLPQGGHLLDIERQYGIDGSMAKRVS